ncbi:MAG: hypothetical protein ISS94_01475 [Candidatus Syntrophoarchaeum sp.]|nr:hypothetical protein [Methanomicrobia archaeon]MBL7117443.1 hypothetical protein [Candidatus Syntrophoarchaeum sp.]
MITAEEVIKSLPELLKEQPELRLRIYDVLSEEFVRRGEFYEFMKKSDERFEQLLQELRAFREDTNRRFEAVDQRFDEVDRRFDKMDSDFKDLKDDFKDLKDWVGIVVGGFQRRAGRSLEDAIAGTLRIALEKDVKPENITMRKKIRDDEGLIGRAGREYEIDLCITNGESMIFEIKSYAEDDDIENFNDKAELAVEKLGLKKAKKVLITLDKRTSVVKLCDKYGILLG